MKSKILKGLIVTLLSATLFACQSYDFDSESDEAIIEKGVTEWNTQGPDAAMFYWSNIRDKDLRDTYTGYIDSYSKGVAVMNKVVANPPEDPVQYEKVYNNLHTTFSSYPDSLNLEENVTNNMAPIAADQGLALLSEYKVTKAQKLLESAVEVYGNHNEISTLLNEAEVLSSSLVADRSAKAMIEKTRAIEDFYTKMDSYEDTIAKILMSENKFKSDASKINLQEKPYFFDGAANLKKKRQNTKLEMDKLLRQRQYSFKERIGEQFARVPEGKKLGSMSLQEMLAFHQGIKEDVELSYEEMKDFSQRYPDVIDKYMLQEVEEQKAVLDTKIAQVIKEIKTAREIASRGKPAMPLMIGLFNPVPGSSEADKKSRPAIIRGKIKSKPHYWWGMVSIPTGTLNDLVITLDDDRPVAVYPHNTMSGKRIEKLEDVVNRGNKIGNSWPVLNAGSKLPTGKYFLEVQEGNKNDYEGEVVVYKSFIMRMR